ncbi:TPA: phage terminase small subunit P27 family [Clostridium perfringens]|uniref:phage terminase small subunit P27 family n=1 Tax=Clostridium perfringens TaxID=1502 RepID=UPI001CCFBCD2|nr:phage terminase small subunit P27 family [Clostridium perfringens]MDH5083516.1 Phage terminase small subunit [Clostridium perfringens]MDH5095993.1 Phage terminase small subunit [Clostridium perfringens]MDK0941204.1 phage terminase small subunit P27 family [Clostridium perfringens]UBK35688.1 phage terminase small subunit P27 family [Clostridium perfringens]UBK72387.1 phage terminase small subunit P27 family [Clostridium perfringens]
MAKASKPVDLLNKHLTKEEYNKRKEQEEKLKGKDDKVYEAPANLSKEGKDIYNFLVGELKESGILNNLDITILLTCVDSILRMEECRKIIDKNGIVITTEDGAMYRNPATTIYKDYNAIFNKCCMELGLSPSSRSKLSVIKVNAKAKENDPVLKALKGK